MANNTNVLANIFNWIGEVFENFNPAAFRFLAATLPYTTPIPVSALTSTSATNFLGFSPFVSGIFVYGLEGIGLWFTTMLVDAIVEAIRSKNKGGWLIVALFAFAVTAYVSILVSLNVTLEEASGNVNPTYGYVVTLLCFLPLITGIGNGWYKLTLNKKTELQNERERQDQREAEIRRENNDLKLKKAALKQGINVFAADTSQVARNAASPATHSSDWRKLSADERHLVINVLSVDEIMKKHGVGRSTAFAWKKKTI